VLARGGKYRIMEGPQTFHRFVVIEFATLEQGVACFESREYQEAAAFRLTESALSFAGSAARRRRPRRHQSGTPAVGRSIPSIKGFKRLTLSRLVR
jgi:hypothetical protein